MTDHEQKLAAARAIYGKPFITDVPIKRKTRKSLFLRQLEKAQAKEQASRAPVVRLSRSR